jgi:hypothetical protein
MRRASVKMSPQWPRSAATSPINTRLCLPPDASSRALDPTTIRRTHLPRHSNPHSRVRGTLRAPSPAGSFLGGFRTTAPGARRSHLDRPSSETLNTTGLMRCSNSGFIRSPRRRGRARAHSGKPAFRRPSISSFDFDCPPTAIHPDIVKAGSISSRRAAASRASASRPRWAKADARQR